jgi:hypothetical protein
LCPVRASRERGRPVRIGCVSAEPNDPETKDDNWWSVEKTNLPLPLSDAVPGNEENGRAKGLPPLRQGAELAGGQLLDLALRGACDYQKRVRMSEALRSGRSQTCPHAGLCDCLKRVRISKALLSGRP